MDLFKTRLLGSAAACSLAALLTVSPVANAQSETSDEAAADDVVTMETVVVTAATGTLIRGVAPTGTNTIQVDEAMIDEISPSSTNDLLSNVPQVSNAFNTIPTPGATIANPYNRPNLRNLGMSGGATTLVLLDGMRMVGSGVLQTSPDVSAISPTAIGNMEVVLDGGSSIYGSDAIGGVINFISKKEIDGIDLFVEKGFGDAYEATDAGIAGGTSWDSGSAYLLYNYSEHDDILGRDRDYVFQDHTPQGGQDYRSTSCTPGTVVAMDIPFALPTLTPGANFCDETDVLSIYPQETNHRVFGKLLQDLSPDLMFEITGYYSDRETVHQGQGPGVGTGVRGSGTITAANPYFQSILGETSQTVAFSYDDAFGPTLDSTTKLSAWMINPKLTYSFGETWQANTSLSYGQSTNVVRTNQVDAVAQAIALSGLVPGFALNPYDVTASDPGVVSAIGNFQVYGDNDQELLQFRTVADGTAFTFGQKEVKAAIGFEYLSESVDAKQGQGAPDALDLFGAASDRDVTSVFGELMLPLMDDPTYGTLDASISARYDSYSDVGDATNPKVGFTYKPIPDFALRGSWGTSFHAPSLADTGNAVDTRVQVFPISPFIAPGDSPLNYTRATVILAGGNPDLKPEEAETFSIGADWIPEDGPLEGLMVSATYFNVEFKDQIAIVPILEPGFFLIDAYTPFYTINPTLADVQALAAGQRIENAGSLESLFVGTSPYLLLDARRNNLGVVETDGVDFGISYTHDTSIGNFSAGFWGTYTLNRDIQATEGSPVIDGLEFGVSQLQYVADLGWSNDVASLNMRVNHSAGFDLTSTTDVNSYTTVDLSARYTIPGNNWRKDTVLTLNVDNLLDQDPPYVDDVDGYGNGSTLGQVVYIGLRQKF
ncbi:MAG: hypothetical protein CMK09_04590 [Ponticaulis sp.]|nr:hypothetical protein [Ponticaulis sp.]|tara:strand:- start:65468 stop:68122 length:2655 start_codon:yes stop_codon:yes gene_type:complete